MFSYNYTIAYRFNNTVNNTDWSKFGDKPVRVSTNRDHAESALHLHHMTYTNKLGLYSRIDTRLTQ